MQRRLVIVLVLIVVTPLVALAWLGVRMARSEQRLVRQRIQEALIARLRDMDARIQGLLEQRAQRLIELTDAVEYRAEALRKLVRSTPEIDQVFIQAPDGSLLHPAPGGELSQAEREFLFRARRIFADRVLWSSMAEEGSRKAPNPASGPGLGAAQTVTRPDHGWYAWYWDQGLHLIFWRQDRHGNLIGAELSRERLLSDVINELPPPADEGSPPIALVDSRGEVVFQLGEGVVDLSAPSAVELPLTPPLGGWRLRQEDRGGPAIGTAGLLAGAGGFLAVALALGWLGIYLYRESTRDLREAAQRVRFVNQVSHELRTPLTNIRLYAELLEQQLDDDDEHAREQLAVIVSESHRLSRLIGNVLAFARQQRGRLQLHPKMAVLDDTAATVIEHFRPSLERAGVVVETSLAAPAPFPFDADAVEQVLANLLSNVEKYAAAGGWLRVASSQGGESATVTVEDHGPGIPREKVDAIFEPFVRLSDRLNEGVSGTGIGLTIARELARLHGGELRLVASAQGARFELWLPTETGRGGRT